MGSPDDGEVDTAAMADSGVRNDISFEVRPMTGSTAGLGHRVAKARLRSPQVQGP